MTSMFVPSGSVSMSWRARKATSVTIPPPVPQIFTLRSTRQLASVAVQEQHRRQHLQVLRQAVFEPPPQPTQDLASAPSQADKQRRSQRRSIGIDIRRGYIDQWRRFLQ